MIRLGMWTILLFNFVVHASHSDDGLESTNLDYGAGGDSAGNEEPCFMMPAQFYVDIKLFGKKCSTHTVVKSSATLAYCMVAHCPCRIRRFCNSFPKWPCPSIMPAYHHCPNNTKSTPQLSESLFKTTQTLTLKREVNRTASPTRETRKLSTSTNERQQNTAPSQFPTRGHRLETTKQQSNSFKKESSKTTYSEKTISLATILSGRMQTLTSQPNSASESKSGRNFLSTIPSYQPVPSSEKTKRGHDGYTNSKSTFKYFSSLEQTYTMPTLTARPASSDHGRKRTTSENKMTTRMASAKTTTKESSTKIRNETSSFQVPSLETATVREHNSTNKTYFSNTTGSERFTTRTTGARSVAMLSASSDASMGSTSQRTSSKSEGKPYHSLSTHSRHNELEMGSSLHPTATHSISFGTPDKFRSPSVQPERPGDSTTSKTVYTSTMTASSQPPVGSTYHNLTKAKFSSQPAISISSSSPNFTKSATSLNASIGIMSTKENGKDGRGTQTEAASQTTYPKQHLENESTGSTQTKGITPATNTQTGPQSPASSGAFQKSTTSEKGESTTTNLDRSSLSTRTSHSTTNSSSSKETDLTTMRADDETALTTSLGRVPHSTSAYVTKSPIKSTISKKVSFISMGDLMSPSSPRVAHSTKNSSGLKESVQSLASTDRAETTTSPETAYNWSSSEYIPNETTPSERGGSAITNCTFEPSKYRLNSTEAEQVRTGSYATRLMTSSAAAPQTSLHYGNGITEKSTPTEAAKSTITIEHKHRKITSTASSSLRSTSRSSENQSEPTKIEQSTTSTTLRSTSSAATPHSSSIYNSSITSNVTSMEADESTTTRTAVKHHKTGATTPPRAARYFRNRSNSTEAEQSTAAGEYPTVTTTTSTSQLHHTKKPAALTKAEQLVTSTDRAMVIKTAETTPQITSVYKAASTATMFESSEATPPVFFTYIVYIITKKNPTFEGDESSSTSENAEGSQTAHSMHSAEKTSVPTEAKHSATSGAYTRVLAKGSKTMPQSSSTSDDPAISNSATLTRNTDNTIARKQGATTATSLSSPRGVNSSRNPSERTDVGRYTKSTDTTLPITSLGTKNQSLTIRETRTTSKHISLKAAKSYRSKHLITTATYSFPLPYIGESSKNSSELAKGIGATLPTKSSESAHQSPIIYKITKTRKHTSLEAAESTITSIVAGEHRRDTVTSSLSSLDSGESSKNSELTNAEQPTTGGADATVTTTSAKSKEHLFLANGASAVRRSTTAEPAGNTNTRIHHASSVTMSVSSAYTIHSTKKAAEGAKTEHSRTSSDTTLDANFVRTHEWPTIQKTGAISNLTISESTEGTKTALTSRRGEPRGNSSSAHGRKYLIWEEPAENTNTDAGIHHTTSVTMPVSSAQSTHSTSEASELAETEQSPTSDNSADLFTTFKTTRQSPSAHSSSASGGSTALERARSTTTNKYHTSIATMSVSPHRTVKSTMKPSDLSEFMQSTGKAAGRTAVVTRSVTTPSPTSLYNASITSKSPSVKPTKSVTTGIFAGKYHTPSVASSDPSSLSAYSTENISGPIEVEEPAASTYTETMVTSTATSRQPSLVYRPNLSENSAGLEQEEGTSTVTGRTKTMPQSTFVASILTETPPLEPGTVAKKHDVNTATTSLPPSHSVKSSKTPSELGEPKQQIMTSSVDTTLGAPNYGPVSQWFSVYTTATTKEAKTKLPGRSTKNTDTTKSTESYTATSQPKIYEAGAISMITSLGAAKSTTASTMAGEHHATAASLLSSYRSVGSSKNLQDLKEAEQALTNTSYKRSSQSPFVRRADYQKKSTEMESASKFSTREYRTTTTTSLPPQHPARHTENSLRLARPEHSTTTAEAATRTISSETISQLSYAYNAVANRSTALKSSRRPHPSTDAHSYYAETVRTLQFVTPVTNATNIISDTMDTEEAATTTDATAVITRSRAMPHYPISSAGIDKKSTTLVKNMSTTTNTTITSTDFETTPKLSLAHSPTFTSKAWRAIKSTAAGKYHTVATFMPTVSPSGVSSTLSSLGAIEGTDAETLVSSTESVSRLRSHGDVYEKQSAKVTKAKSAVTSEMEAPAKIEEATPRHHGDVQCNLNIFSLYNLNDYLNGFGFNQTVDAGETIGIGCQSSGEHKNITLICGKTGLFDPDPSKLNCSSDIKTPMTTRELKSCEQCDAYGTESCEMKADGVVCHCYEHWSGKTCWRAADQCEITPLQCGKHGVCRSEVDYASCACDYGFTGEHCSVTKAKTTIISPHKSSGHLASEASVFVLTWYDIVILVIKAVLLIHSPSDGQDPQTHYQNCRSFVITVAGFLALFFRHPTLFSLSDIECQWVFYIITSCCSLGIAFFAMEAMNAYELYRLKQLNSWTTLFPEHQRSHALLAFRTSFPVVAIATAILVILTPNYKQAVTSWSCLGRFSYETMDLWSPIVLIQMCIALIASAFSYRGLFLRKNLPHLLQKVDAHLEKVPARRRNESKKCERDLIFTAIGPWLLLFYWLTLTLSNDFVAVHDTGFLAVTFAVLYGSCNFLQAVFTTPVEYSNFMWYVMRFFPASYAPKFDPVTMFSRDEVLEVFRQRKIDAEKGKISKAKGFLIWNSTYPDYLPIYARSKILKDWNHLYMNARNSGMTKMEACNAVYKQHVLEMDPDSPHGKQTRKLFLDWSVRIRRADPLPELVENQLPKNKKLKQDFIEVLQNSFLPRGLKRRNIETKNSMEIADSYFPVCSVSSIDKQGNITHVDVLKALPGVEFEEEHLSVTGDFNNNFIRYGSDRNCEWAMTRKEKIKTVAQAQADVVWDMVVQNYDIIQCSKALRI